MKLYHFNENFRNFMVYYFSMAEVDSSNPVMPEWAKPRDKNDTLKQSPVKAEIGCEIRNSVRPSLQKLIYYGLVHC